jgi:DNA-binding CsgD family transcriptional regulator
VDPWRFVGREPELTRLIAAGSGRTGRGLILSGTAGVGKSRLLREAVAGLHAGRHAIHAVSANIATAGLPLGGLAQILPADPPGGSPAGMLRWAVDCLQSSTAGRPIVLAIDDAHLLDATSSAVVYLIAREGATILGTLRSGEPVPLPVRALWSDDLVNHAELAPMKLADATAMLAEMLGGPVEPASAERLWRLSSGNALMLRELVIGTTAGDEMTQAYGMWRWTGRLELVSSLADMVDQRIGQLTPEARRVVELVAFGEPLGLDLLIEATTSAEVETSEERGLIRIVTDDRRHNVALGHALYGEVLRRRCPLTRARRLKACLADLTEGVGARRRDDLLRVAVWRLESGTSRHPARLLQAAGQAFLRLDVLLSKRLARAALDAGGGFEAAELLATILMFADGSDEAMAVLARIRDDITSEAERSRWLTARAMVAYWGLGRSDALDEIAAGAAAIDDLTARARVEAFESMMRLHGMHCEEAQRLARTVLDRPASPPPARALALSTMAHLQAMRGKFAQSARTVATVEADAAQWRHDMPSMQVSVEVAKGTRLALAGDLAGIDEILLEEFAHLSQAGDFLPGLGFVLLLHAHAAALRGQTGKSLHVAVQACAAFATSKAYNAGAHAARAYAAVLRGDAALALNAIIEAEHVWAPIFAVFHPPVEQARAWVTASGGDLAGAVSQLRSLANRLHDDGLAGHELWVLHDLVRLGRPDLAVDGLTVLVDVVEGPLPALFLRHAGAAANGVATELLAVAEEFGRLEFNLFGAEAAATAVRRLRAQRCPTAHNGAAILADLVERCDTVRTPALSVVQTLLSDRERQIAKLASVGIPSREIANQLFLSPRTVDNHLRRVYTKLGVSGRRELGRALRALSG